MTLAIFVSRPPFTVDHTNTEPAHCYDTMHGYHSVTTGLSCILATVVHLMPCFLYNFHSSMLADLKSLCIICIIEPKSSIVSRTTGCPLNPHLFSTNGCCNSVAASDCSTSSPKPLRGYITVVLLETCLCIINGTFAHVIPHRSVFIVLVRFQTWLSAQVGRLGMEPEVARINGCHCVCG